MGQVHAKPSHVTWPQPRGTRPAAICSPLTLPPCPIIIANAWGPSTDCYLHVHVLQVPFAPGLDAQCSPPHPPRGQPFPTSHSCYCSLGPDSCFSQTHLAMATHPGTPCHMASLGPQSHVESCTRPEGFCCNNGPSCSQDPPLHASQKAWAGQLAAGTGRGSPTCRLLHSGRTVRYPTLAVTLSQGMGCGEGARG